MKKLFTLFCAVSLVASAGAVSFVNPQHVPDKARKVFTTSPVELFAIDAPSIPVSEDKATFSVAEDGVITIDNVVAFYLGNYYMNAVGAWQLQFASGKDLAALVQVQGQDGTHIAGTFELGANKDTTLYGGFVVAAPGDTTEIVSANLTIVYNIDAARYEFALSAVCENAKTYTMQYSCPPDDVLAVDVAWMAKIELEDKPFVPTGDTIRLITPAYCPLDRYSVEGESDYCVTNADCTDADGKEYSIGFKWYPKNADNPLGLYTEEEDFDMMWANVYVVETQDILTIKQMALEVYEANDTIYMETNMLASDGNVYYAVLKNYTITATSVENLEFSSMSVDLEYLDIMGTIDFYGENEAYQVAVSVYVDPENIAGKYTDEDLELYGTYMLETATEEYLYVAKYTLEIAASGESYKLTGSMLCGTGVQYNFVIDGNPDTAIDHVNGEAPKAVKSLRNGQLVIKRNGMEYNAAGVRIR